MCPFGHRLGGWVIHFPAVVCISSPSTRTSLVRTGLLPDLRWFSNGLRLRPALKSALALCGDGRP